MHREQKIGEERHTEEECVCECMCVCVEHSMSEAHNLLRLDRGLTGLTLSDTKHRQ